MCAYERKTWIEKREGAKPPQVKQVDVDFADIKKGERMLIANPRVVDAYIRKIPKGETRTFQQLRDDLAHAYGADKTCPVTAGIFLRIVAEAAYEEYIKGKGITTISPVWRMIDVHSPSAKKLSFGTDWLIKHQKKEGLYSPLKKMRHAHTK